MPDAWKSTKIREFEHVLATPAIALLRISGRPSRRRSSVGASPVLLADDGQSVRRFAALPTPPDERGVLRLAYSVGSDLLVASTSFSLELSDGSTLALPAPTPGDSRLVRQPAADAVPEPAERPSGGDERRSGVVSKMTELSARLAESEQLRSELETTAAAATDEADEAKAQLPPLRDRISRLEARLAEADQRAIDSALEIAAAQEQTEELERSYEQLESSAAEQREHLQRLEHDIAEAVQARDELEHAVEPLRFERDRAEQELAERRETIRSMTAERDELSSQTAASDGEIAAARERATEAEAEAEEATAALNELETWRDELERRLTETTDELAAARSARAEDAAELDRLGGELTEAGAKVELLQAHVGTLTDQLAERALADVPTPLTSYFESQRESIARQAEELTVLLGGAGRLTESLLAAATAEPVESGEASAAGEASEASATGTASEAGEVEIEARLQAIGHAAEAEARELAEHELADATAGDR